MGKKHKEKRNLYEIKRFFVDRGVENVISMLREMAENEKDDSNDPDRKVGTLTGKDWRGGEGGGLETNVLSGPKRLKSQEDNKGKAGGSEGEVTSVYEKDNVEPTVAKNNVMKNNAAFPKDMYLLSKDGSFLIKTIRNAYTKNGFNPNVKTVLVNWLDRKKKMEIERGKKIRALAEEDMEKMWFFFKDKIENLIKKVDSATQSNTLLRKKAIQMMQEYNFDKSDIHLGAYVRHEGSFIFIPYDKNTIYKLENGDFLPKGEQKDNSLKESAIPGMTNLVFFDFYRDYYEGFDKLVSGIYNIFEKYGTPTNNTVSKLVVTLLFHYIRFMLPSVTDIKKFRSFLFSSVIDEYELIPRIRTKKKDLTGVENFIVNGDTLYFKIGKEVSFNQLKMKYSFLEEIKEHFFECYQEYYRNEIMLALRRIFFNIEVAKETEDMSKMRTIGKLNIMYILNERINSVLYSIGPCVYVGTETEGNIEVYASSLFEFVGGKDFFVKKDVSGWENKKFSLMKYGITGGLIVFEREALLSSGNRQEIKKKMSQDILKRINNYSKKNFEHFYGDFFMKRVESIIGNTISGYMVGDEQEINAKERYTLPKVGTPYSDIVKKDFDILLKELGQSKFSFLGRMHILFYLIFGNENDEVFIGRDFAQARNYSEEIAAEIDRE
ncbi:MAG: hypothetical protein N3A54_00980, partial [Patescibacteria group bacterium]|nr:hypothetical protein [Patescibacteria group bacterium]